MEIIFQNLKKCLRRRETTIFIKFLSFHVTLVFAGSTLQNLYIC